jgi:subtilisin family serine protease
MKNLGARVGGGTPIAEWLRRRTRRHPVGIAPSTRRAQFSTTTLTLGAVTALLLSPAMIPASSAAALGIPSAVPTAAPERGTVPVVVTFRSATSGADRDAAVARDGVQVVRRLGELRTQVVQVPAGQVETYVSRIRRQSSVERVEPAVKISVAQVLPGAGSRPSTPTAGGNLLSRAIAISRARPTLMPTVRPTNTAARPTNTAMPLQTATVLPAARGSSTVVVRPTPNDPLYAQQWPLSAIGWQHVWRDDPIAGSVTLAILDTGVDATHPDLAGRMVGGTSFTGSDPGTDLNGHGTAMASIAAAQVNNGVGLAGVAYAGVKVVSVQVLAADGTGWDSDVAAGLVWAANGGARVILLVLSSPTYSPVLASAVAYAWSKGTVVVAATGNDGGTEPTYPAGLPDVLGVAATNQQGTVASFSNTGAVAVVAPGVEVEAATRNQGYTRLSGTSAAAAIVAGEAALLTAQGRSNAVVTNQVRAGVDALGGGRRYGRVNLVKALGARLPSMPTATPLAAPTASGPTVLRAAASYVVTNTADDGSGSLRDAVDTAIAGDTITFSPGLTNQTIALASSLTLANDGSSPLIIDGAGAEGLAISGAGAGDSTIVVGSGANVALKNLTIENGQASGGGGIVNPDDGTLEHISLSNNTASFGGGVFNFGSLTVTDTTFSHNTAEVGGGLANGGSLTVTDTTFSDNSAVIGGGIVNISPTGMMTLTRSTLSNNSAPGAGNNGGGGLVNGQGGRATISTSTISNNSTDGLLGGGGVLLFDAGTTIISYTTIAANTASGGGAGGIENSTGGTVTLNGSLVAAGSAGTNCTGPLGDNGHNLDDGVSCGFSSPTSLSNVGVNLNLAASLSGGPRQAFRLLANSVAIDAGGPSCPSTDELAGPRPQGAACDIGAVEYTPVQPQVGLLSSSSGAAASLGQSVTFTATVGTGGSFARTGTVTFFDGGTPLGTGTFISDGTWTLAASSLGGGSHPITANYGGDSSFLANTSAVLAQVVDRVVTTTALVAPPSRLQLASR